MSEKGIWIEISVAILLVLAGLLEVYYNWLFLVLAIVLLARIIFYEDTGKDKMVMAPKKKK